MDRKLLEEMAAKYAARCAALEVALKAFMLTHPDLAAAKSSYDRLSAEALERAIELGFQDGESPQIAGATRQALESELTDIRSRFG